MNDAEVPIFIADYVLTTYGTGAIMAVPGHDERDFGFAKRYGLPVSTVISPPDWDGRPMRRPYEGEGALVNSGRFSGMPSEAAKNAVAEDLEDREIGERKVNYRLHDWLISRQRYWGCPIPIIYCAECGVVPVPERDLPVTLPEDAEFLPTGESPLKHHEGFLHTTCPECHGDAAERNRYDGYIHVFFVVSVPVSQSSIRRRPVRSGRGGLLAAGGSVYGRYRTRHDASALHSLFHHGDAGYEADRHGRSRTHGPVVQPGIILGEDYEKMSKSRGNVVNPDDLIDAHGVDSVRAYLMFISRWDQGGPWNPASMEGVPRFLNRVWSLVVEPAESAGEPPGIGEATELRRITHQAIKKVSADLSRSTSIPPSPP